VEEITLSMGIYREGCEQLIATLILLPTFDFTFSGFVVPESDKNMKKNMKDMLDVRRKMKKEFGSNPESDKFKKAMESAKAK